MASRFYDTILEFLGGGEEKKKKKRKKTPFSISDATAVDSVSLFHIDNVWKSVQYSLLLLLTVI